MRIFRGVYSCYLFLQGIPFAISTIGKSWLKSAKRTFDSAADRSASLVDPQEVERRYLLLQKSPMTNQIDENQFKIVTELLKRQDEALEQLKLLSERVEQAIEFNTNSRDGDTEDEAAEDIGPVEDQPQQKAA